MNAADEDALYLDSLEFSPRAAVSTAKKTQRSFGGNFKGICKAQHDVRYRGGISLPITNKRRPPLPAYLTAFLSAVRVSRPAGLRSALCKLVWGPS
jgi:hypothetical protein